MKKLDTTTTKPARLLDELPEDLAHPAKSRDTLSLIANVVAAALMLGCTAMLVLYVVGGRW